MLNTRNIGDKFRSGNSRATIEPRIEQRCLILFGNYTSNVICAILVVKPILIIILLSIITKNNSLIFYITENYQIILII